MEFIELNRDFAALKKDQEIDPNLGPVWGRKYGGWLDWNDILEHRRVVMLAEALSGKTEELRYRAGTLSQEGKHAYFVRIEDLADGQFEDALDHRSTDSFNSWLAETTSDAWFFLDSVDEARLNHKNFSTALNRFARKLGVINLQRAYIFISCRVSDWKGREDRESIERILPYQEPLKPPSEILDYRTALLNPIFNRSSRSTNNPKETPTLNPKDLLIIQLLPLTSEQRNRLAKASGVNEVAEFSSAIQLNGLEAMAERPGDLLDLAWYWNENGKFGSLREMSEQSVRRKLQEQDQSRADGNLLSAEKARIGAEQLAAALTLGKSFTLRALGQEPDPTLAAGAIDPTHILSDWSPAEQAALLRRGAFTPSTFGRLRFHHRSTQEYLTATWITRLMNAGCPREEIAHLLFVERYGVKTVVPSLRAVAAWLALDHSDIRQEIIKREPLTLIQHGDPKSLPIAAREALLEAYAEHDVIGQVTGQVLDHRAVWMFSDIRLACAIRTSWAKNDRSGFRLDLLRFIREAKIVACVDLARSAALDIAVNDYVRVVAIEAIFVCEDHNGLKQLAEKARSAPDRLSYRLAPAFAQNLYPQFLSVDELLELIDRSQPLEQYTTGGFGDILDELVEATPNRNDQKKLAYGLASICLAAPHVDDIPRLSSKHAELVNSMSKLSIRELKFRSLGEVDEGFIRLLMVVERAKDYSNDESQIVTLRESVRADSDLNRALFWADVLDTRTHPKLTPETRYWNVTYLCGVPLWQLNITDLAWLQKDCIEKPDESDRRIAFSAVWTLLRDAGRLDSERELIQNLTESNPWLAADLAEYSAPSVISEEHKKYEKQLKVNRQKRAKKEAEDQDSWLKFQAMLELEPTLLSDPEKLKTWSPGFDRLMFLTDWLAKRSGTDFCKASREWPLLMEAFSSSVVEAYKSGIKHIWRMTEAERPAHKGSGHFTTKYTTMLSIAGLNLEAAETTDWYIDLTDVEVIRAAEHACLSGQGYPEWLDVLIDKYPLQSLPILHSALTSEIYSNNIRSDLLSHYAYSQNHAHSSLGAIISNALRKKDIDSLEVVERCLKVLTRQHITPLMTRGLVKMVRNRFTRHLAAGNEEMALRYFALQLHIQPEPAILELEKILEAMATSNEQERIEKWLSFFFGRHGGISTNVFERLSILTLTTLLRVVYRHIRYEDDRAGRGGILRQRDHAEDARNIVLSALTNRSGADAYHALIALSEDPLFQLSSIRFLEMAHEKVEQDAELPSWKTDEVLKFEREFVIPVKSGSDLLRLVMSVLSDIAYSFINADASSRPLLLAAKDENEVQHWLAEQFTLRAKSRYIVHRESEVSNGDKPDIVISSSTANVEVAVELKHGDKGWTVKQLDHALKNQLAENYLKPANRRQGVLVVTCHSKRKWQEPGTRIKWTFSELSEWLNRQALGLLNNRVGEVEVRVFGLDAFQNNAH